MLTTKSGPGQTQSAGSATLIASADTGLCDICKGEGYHLIDVGTATIPDYVSVRCACNPEPMADWEDTNRFNDAKYEGL